ncbi:MAG TPA: YMGG-like glycine zipper-containing protein [Bradyrhizobium sp.]|uniref:YMGG-like glycine zipper-containing protein n=1 Tax=Bradyrhizobium sp. TaxID=376 RepID=UPI002B575357|nr:YMGG-like glycine zipper-containing protein [Bradyrhizobium sp.]HLZ02763.1 YMGG-like glycine zipper-containing protein [Bradyrhizobium sp.]
MIRRFGIAALLGLAVAMTAQEAAAQNNTLGGALFGGAAGAIVGGALGGGRGAAIGAVIGAGTGAAIGSEGDRRRGGYYWYHDGCYIQRGDGYWMRVDPRYCY